MVLLSHTGCTSLLTVLALGLPTQCFPYLDCFIEFVKILLLFYFLIFLAACEFLAPVPRIEPAPPALEDKVVTPGPSEKSE